MKGTNVKTRSERYEAEKRKVTARIVGKQSRGNVNVQNGVHTAQELLTDRSRRADEQLREIEKMLEKAF